MKILVTGMTATQCGTGRNGVCTLTERAAMVLAQVPGVVVEWRPVDPLEDLSEYDCALVAVYEPRGATSGFHKYGALWAMMKLPYIALYDDWHVRMIVRTWRYALQRERGEDFWRLGLHAGSDCVRRQRNLLMSGPHADEAEQVWRDFAEHGPDFALFPQFEWGDLSRLQEISGFSVKKNAFGWDPTPAARGIFGYDPDNAESIALQKYGSLTPEVWTGKCRRHVLAALSDHSQWLSRQSPRPEWEVSGLCPPAKARHTGKTSGQTLGKSWGCVSERQVVETYLSSESAVSPPYPGFEGVGWWRNRVPFALDAGAALVASPQEFPHGFAASFAEVEADPRAVWRRQVEFLGEHTDTYASCQRTLLNSICRSFNVGRELYLGEPTSSSGEPSKEEASDDV